MARGWESKSVEEQMASSQQQSSIISGGEQDRRRQVIVDKAHIARQRQSLHLQRENILAQRTSNPGRRAALEAALEHVEKQITALD
jgi:hypothetical protein